MVIGKKLVTKKVVIQTNDDNDLSPKDSAYVIKQKTHEELEIEIQTDRVLLVLAETITKIKIAAHLGYLSQNAGALLVNYLPMKDVEFIVGTCNLFLETKPSDSENRSIISTTDTLSAKFNERTLLMKEKHDVLLLQSIDIIFACPELMAMINELDIGMDILSTSLIEGIMELKSVAKDKLSVSASQERDNEATLKNAWKENQEALSLIEGLEERLNKQNEELEVQLEAKDQLINMYSNQIEQAQSKFREDIKKKVTKSEKEMIQRSQISEEKQQLLSQEAKDATTAYNQLLDQHLAAEKLLRAKRFKVETQLGGWIEKYDKDIGDRQAELEALQEQYDSEKAEMDALQAKFDEQEEEYLELMGEKNAYDEAIFNKKYYMFLMNRAARRIQRCWRAYRERKKARRKARQKKKGKGKKAAEVIQEPEPEPIVTEDIEKDMFGDTVSGAETEPEEPLPAGEEEIVIGKKKKGKGKGKGKKKDKMEKPSAASMTRVDDPNAVLSKSKLASHVFENISETPLPPGPVDVDLNA